MEFVNDTDFYGCDICDCGFDSDHYPQCIKCDYLVCNNCIKKHECHGAVTITIVPFPDLTMKIQKIKN
jgi:hypothetical protein